MEEGRVAASKAYTYPGGEAGKDHTSLLRGPLNQLFWSQDLHHLLQVWNNGYHEFRGPTDKTYQHAPMWYCTFLKLEAQSLFRGGYISGSSTLKAS
jgi:hypothetical protein